MGEPVVARLTEAELPQFRDFCRENWGGEHPLIHNERLFRWYYERNGALNFAVARSDAGIESVCGWIAASPAPAPDVWISYILTRKGAPLGLGFRLLEFIRGQTGCRTIACNNIRPKTRGLYEFFGYTVAPIPQFYRMNAAATGRKLSALKKPPLPVTARAGRFVPASPENGFAGFDFGRFAENAPFKDAGYVTRRYFENPWLRYECFALLRGGRADALLVLREISFEGASALRVVDLIGARDAAPACGGFLDALMRARRAELCDWFAYGVPDAEMAQAGFSRLLPGAGDIAPLYLEPPVLKNEKLWMFTSGDAGYRMFRADGDQDRANLG